MLEARTHVLFFSDRLPCAIWGNGGNAANVLFCNDLVVAIDSQVTAISVTRYERSARANVGPS